MSKYAGKVGVETSRMSRQEWLYCRLTNSYYSYGQQRLGDKLMTLERKKAALEEMTVLTSLGAVDTHTI